MNQKETLTETIKVELCNEHYFVWDPDHVIFIKSKWRVVGSYAGCSPLQTLKNNGFGLPFELSKIEIKFLLLKHPDQIMVVEITPLVSLPDFDHEAAQKLVASNREKQYKLQMQLALSKKEKFLEENAFSILKGKRSKRKRSITSSASDATYDDDWSVESEKFKEIKASELQKVRNSCSLEKTWIQLPVQSEYGGIERVVSEKEVILSPREDLKLRVFMDFHSRNFYLTNGLKFGGHFLAYPGEPALYHSSFIVYCQLPNENFSDYTKSTHGRMSASVNKTFLICSLGDDEKLSYRKLVRVDNL